MNDFVLPYFGAEVEFTVSRAFLEQAVCDFNFERRDRRVAVREFSSSHPTAQETKLFRTFSGLALGGKPERKRGEITLKTQKVMMACFESGKRDGALVEVDR